MKMHTPVLTDVVHLLDYNIPPGVEEKVGSSDDWPGIAKRILDAELVIFATPIWWNNRSSLMQRAIERMDAFTDSGGLPGRHGLGKMIGKVAGIVITGGEDGGQTVQAQLMEPLTYFGFSLPPLCSYFEIGYDDKLRDKSLTATAESLVKAALAARPAIATPGDSLEDKVLSYNKHGRPTTNNDKNKLYIVSSDTDGVLANWVDGFLKVFNKKYGKNLTHDQWIDDKPWELDPPLMTKDQFEETFDACLHEADFYSGLKPYDNIDFKQVNQDLDDALYNLYVVTKRVNLLAPHCIQDTTQLLTRWVHDKGILLVTGCNAGNEDRPKLLEQLGVDFHLDDWILQVQKINKHGKTKAFLMDRPWNRQFDVGKLRVFSFEEFLNKTVFAKTVSMESI